MQKSIGASKRSLPPYMVAIQLKILIPVGTPTSIVEAAKKVFDAGGHADGEHVMRPDAEADEANCHNRPHHGGAAKNGLREKTGIISERTRSREDKNVDFRMPKNPEEMLPQHSGAARLRIEKVCAEIAIQFKHDLRRGKRRQSNQNQPAESTTHQPHEQRHLARRHSRTTHRKRRSNHIDRAGNASKPGNQDAEVQ